MNPWTWGVWQTKQILFPPLAETEREKLKDLLKPLGFLPPPPFAIVSFLPIVSLAKRCPTPLTKACKMKWIESKKSKRSFSAFRLGHVLSTYITQEALAYLSRPRHSCSLWMSRDGNVPKRVLRFSKIHPLHPPDCSYLGAHNLCLRNFTPSPSRCESSFLSAVYAYDPSSSLWSLATMTVGWSYILNTLINYKKRWQPKILWVFALLSVNFFNPDPKPTFPLKKSPKVEMWARRRLVGLRIEWALNQPLSTLSGGKAVLLALDH